MIRSAGCITIFMVILAACMANRENDVYARVPFRPNLVCDSRGMTLANTEDAPYLDTRITIYVGWVNYTAIVGTVEPGQKVSRQFVDFANAKGEVFDPENQKGAHIEVRASFRGYDDHKDFPPPR